MNRHSHRPPRAFREQGGQPELARADAGENAAAQKGGDRDNHDHLGDAPVSDKGKVEGEERGVHKEPGEGGHGSQDHQNRAQDAGSQAICQCAKDEAGCHGTEGTGDGYGGDLGIGDGEIAFEINDAEGAKHGASERPDAHP